MPARFLKRGLWALGLAVLALALFMVALPFVASTRIVRDRIALEMGAWSGYRVSIGSPPEISIWPRFRATLTDVTLSPWDPSGGSPVLDADRVELDLSALAAVAGSIRLSSARLFGPTLRVEETATGLRLPSPQGGGRMTRAIDRARSIVSENRTAPDASRLPSDPFGTIEFTDGRIVATGGTDETEIATGLAGRINWASLNKSASLSATGVWRGEDFSLDLSMAKPLILFAGGASPLAIALKSAPANLQFDGTASLLENAYVDGALKFSSASVKRLLEWSRAGFGSTGTPGPMKFESRVAGSAQRLRFENVVATFDGNPGSGALDLLLTGKRPVVSGTLAFDTLDLSALLSAFLPADAEDDNEAVAAASRFVDRFGVDLRLSADSAIVGSVALSDVAATARVNEGIAAFDISDSTAFGGTIQAGLRLDREPTHTSVEVRLLASDIDGGALGTAIGMNRLTPIGRGTVSLILKGPGENWEAILGNANGSISANFRSGALSGFDLDSFLAQTRKGGFFPLETVSKVNFPFDALDLKASISNGIATLEKAEARSARSRIGLSGVISLAEGGLALTGFAGPATQPAPKDAGADFFVGGSWSAPFISQAASPAHPR